MEVNRIVIAIWATVKHIAVALEDENDDSNKEIIYTPLQDLLEKKIIKLENRMFQDHNRRQSKTLLDYHKAIVKQLFDSQCAIFCVSPNLKRCYLPT
jgi:hypothetical protein